MTLKGAGVGAAVALILAGAAFWSYKEAQARAAAVAKQAAIAKAAEGRADSLALAVQRADEAARRDSVAAEGARAAAGRLEAQSAVLVRDNRALRQKLTLQGDTAVSIGGAPPVPIPLAVGLQLRSDDSVIAALQATVAAQDSAIVATVRLATGYKVARDSAEAEVASLRQANAALHAQVKLLAPSKCGHLCSGLVGAGAAILATAAIRRL